MKEVEFWTRRRKIILGIMGIALVIFFLFGAKIALYLNFLLGNDTVVKLTTDKEAFTLLQGDSATVTFEASVATNPFCRADCTALFEDVSTGEIIEQSLITLRPGIPISKKYGLNADKKGRGLQLYRFSMECASPRTVLCHTSEEATTRSILITVSHDLNAEERDAQQEIRNRTLSLAQLVAAQEETIRNMRETVEELALVIPVPSLKLQAARATESLQGVSKMAATVEQSWTRYDFTSAEEKLRKAESVNINKTAEELTEEVEKVVAQLQQAQRDLSAQKEVLVTFKDLFYYNVSVFEQGSAMIAQLNSAVLIFSQYDDLTTKRNAVDQAVNESTEFMNEIHNVQQDLLRKEIGVDLARGVLCEWEVSCSTLVSVVERVNESLQSLQACGEVRNFREEYAALREQASLVYENEQYPNTMEFRETIQNQVHNALQQKKEEYASRLPSNGTRVAWLQVLLEAQPLQPIQPYPDYNLTPALVLELEKYVPLPCSTVEDIENQTLPEFRTVPLLEFRMSLDNLRVNDSENGTLQMTQTLAFREPAPQCCVFGHCSGCCTTLECQEDPNTYPVLFLHGHAINKDTSAEYSLEGFNSIQQRLEKERYISAGAITLYTSRDTPEGEWGLIPAPVTIRGSYYFDIFQSPENYIAVQAKSENIDTYAIRLRDVIETVRYKTGKPKVKIVAFSMGGLVARRYVQLFGEDTVHSMVLIGTPNKGIVGSVAQYCDVIGEQKECQDMNAESLFMKRLNSGNLPAVPVTVILGTGCDMDGEQGDGAVLAENARLEWAKNIVINGTCESAVKPLHLELRDIDKYPAVYDAVLEGLRN